MAEMKSLKVSKETWKTLQEIKLSEEQRTLNDVIGLLIGRWWDSLE